MGSSLRWSSQKSAYDGTQSMKLQAREGARSKSSKPNEAHKRLVITFPQVVEPHTSNPQYVPMSDTKSSKSDDVVICLDYGEEGAPNTHNDSTYVEQMERPW